MRFKIFGLILSVCFLISVVHLNSYSAAINHALNRPCSYSSYLDSTSEGKFANDDRINNYWVPAASTMDRFPWWQVDLQAKISVSKIELVSDQRKEVNFLSPRRNFQVLASNDEKFNDYVILGEQGSNPFEHLGTWSINVDDPEGYRYIRIAKTVSEGFAIAELRVFGVTYKAVSDNFNDVVNTKYEIPVSFLSAFNIVELYDDGSFKPQSTITRGEFVQIITKILSMDETRLPNLESKFSDVNSEYWAKEEVDFAVAMGLIDGRTATIFEPEEQITQNEALCAIVKLLGYEVYAKNKGGYPIGYSSIASNIGIINNILFNGNAFLKRGDMSILLYNAFNTKMLEQIGFGLERSYEVSNKTLLNEYFNIYKSRGVISGTQKTQLTDIGGVGFDKIVINKTTYNDSTQKAMDYLGYNVEYYYKDNEDLEIVYIYPIKNRALTINAEDLSKTDADFSITNIVWIDENDRTKKEKISIEADVIYNGYAYLEYSANTFKIDMGNIKLIDNNEDGIYDVVFVNCYENYLVEGIDYNELIIYDYYNKVLKLKDFDDKKISIVNTKGQTLKFSAIREFNVVSAFISKDNSSVMIIISNEKMNGTVTEIGDDTFLVDNKLFNNSYQYKNMISLKKEELTIDLCGNFYFDYTGKLAGIEKINSNEQYGYLINAKSNKTLDENESVVRIFTADGNIKNFPVYKKVTLNTVQMDWESVIADTVFNNNGHFNHQLIQYKLNTKGGITNINTAKITPNPDFFSLDCYLDSALYRGKIFASQITLNSNSVIFRTPSTVTPEGTIDEADLAILKPEVFSNDSTYYRLTAYDVDETQIAGVLTIPMDKISEVNDGTVTLVDRVVSSLNSEQMIVDTLYGYRNGTQVRYYAAENVNLNGLSRGEIIRILFGKSNEIIGYESLLDKSSMDTGAFERILSGTDAGGQMVVSYGDVLAKNKNIFSYTFNNKTTIRPCIVEGASIYIYNKQSDTISEGTMADIIASNDFTFKGTKVFIYRSYNLAKIIVIIK